MENTLENKAKFFAQYWGQEIFGFDDGATIIINSYTIKLVGSSGFLELKPLSSITDEDLNKTNYGCKEMILEKGIWLDVTNADTL